MELRLGQLDMPRRASALLKPLFKPLPVSGRDRSVSCSLVTRAISDGFRDLVV